MGFIYYFSIFAQYCKAFSAPGAGPAKKSGPENREHFTRGFKAGAHYTGDFCNFNGALGWISYFTIPKHFEIQKVLRQKYPRLCYDIKNMSKGHLSHGEDKET